MAPMTKLLLLPTSPRQAEPAPRRVNPLPLVLRLTLGSLRVSWAVRSVKRRGRLALVLSLPWRVHRAWKLARRAWR